LQPAGRASFSLPSPACSCCCRAARRFIKTLNPASGHVERRRPVGSAAIRRESTVREARMLTGGARCVCALQPMEIFVDDEAKLTLHGLVQHYIMLQVRPCFPLLLLLVFLTSPTVLTGGPPLCPAGGGRLHLSSKTFRIALGALLLTLEEQQ